MDQMQIGAFIAQKRREKNLTQEKLAQRIGVSNKTVSKWETGKCLPDYSIVQSLCRELEISVSELMDGETQDASSFRAYDNDQILDLLKRMQNLEDQKTTQNGILLTLTGLVFLLVHFFVGGSDVRDFVSGLLLGLSIVQMIVGIYLAAKSFSRQQNREK